MVLTDWALERRRKRYEDGAWNKLDLKFDSDGAKRAKASQARALNGVTLA
jgi:hypothetical protein